MPEEKSKKLLKTAAFVALVFVVGIAGVITGQLIRDKLPSTGNKITTMRAPRSLLLEGAMFPAVDVTGPDGATMNTVEMIGSDGCVVLFIDLECPPCKDMTDKWQKAADEGVVGEGQLWAVAYQRRDAVDAYVAENGLTFPVVVDTARTFMYQYEVNRFPLEVVVGASGTIRSSSYDSTSPVDAERVAGLLAD